MQTTGKKLLWATSWLFGHPRYKIGTATAPQTDVSALADDCQTPKEPTKRQYDSNAAACLEFLEPYDSLARHFELNPKVRQATLTGHPIGHEMQLDRPPGKLGLVAINCDNRLPGWDPDTVLTNICEADRIAIKILKNQRLSASLNFESKVRRGRHPVHDLARAYIADTDTMGRSWGSPCRLPPARFRPRLQPRGQL